MATQPAATGRHCQLRKDRYKQLLDDGSIIGENAETADVLHSLRGVQHILNQSNRIAEDGNIKERVENTSEVVLDAQVIKMSHELLGSVVQTIDGGEFNDDQFVLAIRELVDAAAAAAAPEAAADTSATSATNPASGWQRLAELAAPLCRSFRWSQGMLGTFDAETALGGTPALKQRQQRAPRTQQSQQVRPEEVGVLRMEEKPAQVLNVILKQLRQIFEQNGSQPIPYYATVVDPGSYMHTVDNCFQVAFLFRDGHLMLDVDADGLPTIGPVLAEHRGAREFQQQKQMVSSINPALWRSMIERYGLEEPVLTVNRDELELTQNATQNTTEQVSQISPEAAEQSGSSSGAGGSSGRKRLSTRRR